MTSVERLDQGPLRVGSRARIKQPRLPVAVWEVTDVVPGQSFTWIARGPGIVTTGSHIVTPTAGANHVKVVATESSPYSYALPACYWADSPPTERPTEVTFQTCADGSQRLENLTWSRWGSQGAEGKGTFSYKVCTPNCAQGYRAQYPVVIHAADPQLASADSGCPTDTAFYTDMVMAFPTSVPNSAGLTITQHNGMPAVQFTSNQGQTDGPFLGRQLCY